MKLLKQLVQFLLGDEKKDEGIDKVQSGEKESATTTNTYSNGKNINTIRPKEEAKVSYQYPKGNFKFPIIPDTPTTENKQRRTARSYEKTTTIEVKERSSDLNTSVKRTPVNKEAEKPRRPFHPTTIPSPIYGYQSRGNTIDKSESVETANEYYANGTSIDNENESSAILDREEVTKKEKRTIVDKPTDGKNKEYEQVISLVELGKLNQTVEESIDEVHEEETTGETIIESFKTDEAAKTEAIIKQSTLDTLLFEDRGEQAEDPKADQVYTGEDAYESARTKEKVLEQAVQEPAKEVRNEDPKTTELFEQKDELRSQKKERENNNNQSNNKSEVPFNVMMLGRDKQRIRQRENNGYQFPKLTYLNIPANETVDDQTWLIEQKELLDVTLKNFNVRASVVNVTQGPSVTRFEVHPEPGVKVNKITNLSDDIKLSLAAKDIRIEAPIPGKNTIGIEVPNQVSKTVYLREILRSPDFITSASPMTAVLGLDISGQPVVTDLKKMPHGLIAGATGSGKSVCINTILISLMYKASPADVKFMLIDPKMVELAPYNNIPHLVSPVITDAKAATAALKWAVEEMERRYELFAHSGAREITRYNQLVKDHRQGEHLPYLVIIIDELADLMMVAPSDVEEAISRIAQKARACGIHLIVATQRPSVDVITGLIKANIPTRVAFSVSSQVDSRTIIDVSGAEKLLGKGDMLFLENGTSKAVRLQGTFVSDEEIERVVQHVKQQQKPSYLFHQEELIKKATIQAEEDELFLEACEFVIDQGGASTSLLQRRFRIGYNRAARLIDMMEEQGIISENRGSKPRDVLISEEELTAIQESSTY